MNHHLDSRTGPGLAALILLAAVLASFGASLTGGFVWDDGPLIVDNPMVKVPGEYPRLLTSSFWETDDGHDRFRSFYRPLVSATYALDYAVWGLRPFGFHLTNLVLHFFCCWLVYRIAENTGLPSEYALIAGMVFAAHPVHVESVAWISGRTDLLCTMFVLGSFLAFRRGTRQMASRLYIVGAWFLFLLALLAKEMAATLPLLIACDSWMAGGTTNQKLRAAMAAAAPFLAVLGIYALVRTGAIGNSVVPMFDLGSVSWMATAAFVTARYLVLLMLPLGLDAHYPYSPLDGFFNPLAIVSVAVLLTAAAGTWILWRRAPAATFWVAWFVVALAPVMAFGRFGDVIMADRFLYLPSVGFCVLLALGIHWFVGRAAGRRSVLIVGVALALMIPLVAASWKRTSVWKNDHTLFSSMLETSPDSALVRYNYGLALYGQGELDRSIDQFRFAVRIAPSYAMAHNNLGAALERTGEQRQALTHYRRAVELAPDAVEPNRNLAHLMVRVGRVTEGRVRLDRLLGDHPRSPEVLYVVADVSYRLGAVSAAVEYLETALRVDPWHAESHYFLGKIRFEQGRSVEAAARMERFLELWPAEGINTDAARRVIADARTGGPSGS